MTKSPFSTVTVSPSNFRNPIPDRNWRLSPAMFVPCTTSGLSLSTATMATTLFEPKSIGHSAPGTTTLISLPFLTLNGMICLLVLSQRTKRFCKNTVFQYSVNINHLTLKFWIGQGETGGGCGLLSYISFMIFVPKVFCIGSAGSILCKFGVDGFPVSFI